MFSFFIWSSGSSWGHFPSWCCLTYVSWSILTLTCCFLLKWWDVNANICAHWQSAQLSHKAIVYWTIAAYAHNSLMSIFISVSRTNYYAIWYQHQLKLLQSNIGSSAPDIQKRNISFLTSVPHLLLISTFLLQWLYSKKMTIWCGVLLQQ